MKENQITSVGLSPTATISADMLRKAPNMPQDAFVKALLNQAANILEDPVIKEKFVKALKDLIPGKVFDGFADNLYAMAITALRNAA